MKQESRAELLPSVNTNDRLLHVSHQHEAMMYHMLANPTQTGREVAQAFGITANYFHILVNNDLFKARFNELKKEYYGSIMEPLTAKIQALATMAVERWGEQLENSADPEYIKSSADKLLQRLGYGATSKVGVNVQVNNAIPALNTASPEAIRAANAARARLREIREQAEEVPYVQVESGRN